ncbi:restriction endonuclease subunit S [Methanosarcina mazei]|uniref:Type I restriction modification DNA specificity domain-containing protein n=1 Tax=Methanosarcina mazei TaxID=2209 RepID=A0A0F8GFQ7_METMZ|nr:restriction endonuclease subunit S [Methanosarcina mazei]KKG64087.1 hypothetical protein DU67_13515 [Methanosarcina mazei]
MEETISEIQLPDHWAWVELKDLTENPKNDIVDGPFGSNLKSNEFIEVGIPVFKIQNIKENRFVDKNINFVSPTKAEELSRHSFQKGDLIITKLGNPLGLCCKVPEKYPYGIIVADLMRFRPSTRRVVVQYLMYGINSVIVQNQFKAITKGTTRPRVNLTIVRGIKFPFPPLPEQRAIVSKIEQLFSELDNGIANLKLAQEQLKVYRQAVLKKAFEGELTKKWREQQTDLPDAGELLEKISKGREQVIKTSGERQKSTNPLTEDKLAELPSLPEGWGWAKICQVSKVGTGVTPLKKRRDFYEGGTIPWVTSGALNESYVNLASDYVTEVALKETNLKLYPKHTLLVALYGEGKTRGKCSELLIEATTNQAIAAIVQKGTEEKIRPYLKWFFMKNYNEIRMKSSGGVQPNLNLGIIENTSFPLCSLPEQQAIVQEIETRLSVCDKIEQAIKENLEKAEALRQSILKKAFEGKLLNERELAEVRGAEDWEPAEVLLERIKAEKAQNGKKIHRYCKGYCK